MIYPGKIPDKALEDWFSNAASKAGYVPLLPNRGGSLNPCLKVHGSGPIGKKCKECKLLSRHGRYFKCGLRHFTHGPGSDHRANWPACGKFEASH